ncbi:hypothetical protein [Microbacterium jejuense]|uniref:hypothetical protein n=1 Tax=Microbacterium jejuense TaxID=1263637 RepID=UPI0031EBFA17
MDIYTKQGHRVHVLAGNASGITERGKEIEDLGDQMHAAADVLQEIGGGATEEKGRSIEKIRNEVGDTYKELRLAGDRYKPTGTAMKRYGSKLDTVQSMMRTIVRDAEQAKRDYDSAKEAADTASSTASSSADYDPTDATAKTQHQTDAQDAHDKGVLATKAQTALNHLLDDYDTQWGHWDEAYEDALGAINDATHGNVTDDWTDNLAGVVDVVLKVLTWVGVALAIAALIIGGPILAALAAIVGVIALLGTLFLYAKGRKTLTDVAWAVVGVLPFGKLAKLGPLIKGGKFATAGKSLVKIPFDEIATPIKRIKDLRGLAKGGGALFRSDLSEKAAAGLARNIRSSFSSFGGAGLRNIPTRILGGSSRAYTQEFAKTFASFSAHHQQLMTPQLRSLADVVSSGSSALSRTEQVANVVDFAVKRSRMVNARANDIASWGDPQPVDTWREQLAS